MNKKVLTIIGVIIIVVVIGIGAFLIGSKLTNNKNQEEKQSKTESTTENETFNKIMSTVNEYSNENGVDVTITAELMNELTDLYSSNPSKFNKDTVGEYLMDNGWIVRGSTTNKVEQKTQTKGNSLSDAKENKSNYNNSSYSNSKTSNTNNDTENQQEEKQYIHTALSGCVIVDTDETAVTYKNKCDGCNYEGTTRNNIYHSSGIYTSSFTCPNCKTVNSIKIETKSK